MHHYVSDTALLLALKKQEEPAFDYIYERWFRQLCYFADSLVHHKEEAEDIVTNGFVKLLQQNPDFGSLDKLKSYLFTVVRNSCLDVLKQKKRHAASHQELRFLQPEGEGDLERALIRSEALQTLYAAIENLPSQCRTVIRLSFVEGKSVREIADEMQLAYQTVQNQKQRGIKLLRWVLLQDDRLSVAALLVCMGLLQEHFVSFSWN